jgi:hypothetical protein
MWAMVLRLLSKCLAKHGGAQPCGHDMDTYQNNNVGNVGNVGYGFEVAQTPQQIARPYPNCNTIVLQI